MPQGPPDTVSRPTTCRDILFLYADANCYRYRMLSNEYHNLFSSNPTISFKERFVIGRLLSH